MAKKTKYTYPQLALINWLMGGDRFRFVTYHSYLSGASAMAMHELGEKDDHGKYPVIHIHADEDMIRYLGGRATVDTHRPYKDGLFNYMSHLYRPQANNSFQSKLQRPLSHNDRIYLPTKKMREYWITEGLAEYQKQLAKREKEKDAVGRFVIIGKTANYLPQLSKDILDRVPKGFPVPLPKRKGLRPQHMGRVVKETSKRLYLEDVVPLRSKQLGEPNALQGYKPNLFVEFEDVIVDNATESLANTLVFIDNEYQQDIDRIADQAMSEILPLLLNLESRLIQKEAEREDAIREALENHSQVSKPSRG